ncbi:MAG: pyruvoyl-dependent arginine decarboxylase [Peptococcaceae bacterium BICA1-7]|nr:MAG: pyruvoyl-dependent arginine decarboxylase [Peptococcaceae bacterium BICA1-7]HBV97020.1 arginine decarboxylase, pyruvoyl-dependent [Desulfotomaculum sp.]
MLPTPKKFFLTAASSEGHSELTAFDNALLAGRIGNINLIRVSSILPPGAELDEALVIPPGSLVPTAYGYIISREPGQLIAAAVGVGFSKDAFGVIMEHSCIGSREDAGQKIEKMLKEAFTTRGMELVDIKIATTDHRVQKIGCALAAVPMWY